MQSLRWFRSVAYVEGISYILLVFVAMPLKYWADLPLAVRVVGGLHGALFVLFGILLAKAASERSWPAARWAIAFVSSLVPFGTFVFDRSLKREIDSLASLSTAPTGGAAADAHP